METLFQRLEICFYWIEVFSFCLLAAVEDKGLSMPKATKWQSAGRQNTKQSFLGVWELSKKSFSVTKGNHSGSLLCKQFIALYFLETKFQWSILGDIPHRRAGLTLIIILSPARSSPLKLRLVFSIQRPNNVVPPWVFLPGTPQDLAGYCHFVRRIE